MKKITYSDSGVDVKKADEIHSSISSLVLSTQNKYSSGPAGHYAGMIKVGKQKLAITVDGVGSKLLVAEHLGKYDTVGIDCVAMVVNDLICIGAKPIAIVDYLAVEKEDEKLIYDVMKGFSKASRESGCAILGGETAVLPNIITGKKKGKGFDIAATAIGVLEGELITGKKLKPGQTIIGFASSGIHSNGYSLARKVIPKKDWKAILTPTKLYVKPVLEILKKCKVSGLANITGGGFSKLMRIGKQGKVGFMLDAMPPPMKIFRQLQKNAGVDDYEMHRTFNMGVGFVVIAHEAEAKKIIKIASKYKLKPRVIGRTIKKQDVMLKKGKKEISLL